MNTAEQKVLDLEQTRLMHGYKEGWLFYRCKEQELLEEYSKLKKLGKVVPFTRKSRYTNSSFPLTIELVPETCWFSNVRSNISSEDWDILRKDTFKLAQYRCEICGGEGDKWKVECHEIWHYDDANRIQKLNGLIALCPDCHLVKHIGLANIKGKKDYALRHLAKVNQWSFEQALSYADAQYKIWLKRSKGTWELDVSLLKNKGVNVQNTDRRVDPVELIIEECREKEEIFFRKLHIIRRVKYTCQVLLIALGIGGVLYFLKIIFQ